MMQGGLLVGSVLLSQWSYSLKLLGTGVLVGMRISFIHSQHSKMCTVHKPSANFHIYIMTKRKAI
jgi:hypothetical protein